MPLFKDDKEETILQINKPSWFSKYFGANKLSRKVLDFESKRLQIAKQVLDKNTSIIQTLNDQIISAKINKDKKEYQKKIDIYIEEIEKQRLAIINILEIEMDRYDLNDTDGNPIVKEQLTDLKIGQLIELLEIIIKDQENDYPR